MLLPMSPNPPLLRASPTTPMISNQPSLPSALTSIGRSIFKPGARTCCPMGSAPARNLRTKAWFTSATCAGRITSDAVNTRPCKTGTPRVSNVSGLVKSIPACMPVQVRFALDFDLVGELLHWRYPRGRNTGLLYSRSTGNRLANGLELVGSVLPCRMRILGQGKFQ